MKNLSIFILLSIIKGLPLILILSSLLTICEISNSQTRDPVMEFKAPIKNAILFSPFLVQDLSSYEGQYLSIYYALGGRPPLSTNGSNNDITLRNIFHKVPDLPIPPHKQEEITLVHVPQVSIEKPLDPMSQQVTAILFVVHKSPNFRWKNPDGSYPHNEVELSIDPNNQNSNNSEYSDVYLMTISDYKKLLKKDNQDHQNDRKRELGMKENAISSRLIVVDFIHQN